MPQGKAELDERSIRENLITRAVAGGESIVDPSNFHEVAKINSHSLT